LCGQHKKKPARAKWIESKIGLAKRERNQAGLYLEPFVIAEKDVLVERMARLLKYLELLAVDAFRFKDKKFSPPIGFRLLASESYRNRESA
jgi:hypothetical protein